MMLSQSTIDYLNKLPEPYASIAIQRCREYPQEPGRRMASTSEALFWSFLWNKTPEGHAFWEKVKHCVENNTPKKLPRRGLNLQRP
jgi:hypothetical protein